MESSAPGPSRAPYEAPPSDIGQVIATEPLVLRDRPGTENGSTAGGRLYPNMRFRFLEGPVPASGYDWYRVRVGVLEGWVADGLRSDTGFEPWLAHVENGSIALSAADYDTEIPEEVNLFTPNGQPLVQLTHMADFDLTVSHVRRDSGNLLALTCGVEVSNLTWSSDGQLLAFNYGGCDRAAFTVQPVAGGQQRIADGRTMALSPDGRWMIVSENYPYVGCRDPGCDQGPWELHQIDLVSGDASVLTHSDPFVTTAWPDWSPDGRTVAFTVDTVGSFNPASRTVWTVDLASGVERRLADGQLPRWSPDGTRLAVLHQASDQEEAVIWIIGADGSAIAEIGESSWLPAWSPAGDRIVHWRQTGADPAFETVVLAPDGSSQLVAPVAGRALGWSPDGREVLIAGEDTLWRWTPGEPSASVIVDGMYISSAAWQPRLVPVLPAS